MKKNFTNVQIYDKINIVVVITVTIARMSPTSMVVELNFSSFLVRDYSFHQRVSYFDLNKQNQKERLGIMRVTGGRKRGALLFVPDTDDIRPTSDKVKQAVFNMLAFSEISGNCLDLFAGSGAMGIEAVSRMNLFCDFADIDTKTVLQNVKKCGFEKECAIHREDFSVFLSKTKNTYGLVFLDPPYHKGYIEKALFGLVENKLLAKGATVVAESDFDEEYKIPNEIKIIKEKNYGRIKIKIGVFDPQ